jgi:hypothetical protein
MENSKNNITILYYTSNKEDPKFEGKIRENLLKVCGNLPIISISHKPISLGKNICVGDVGASGFNMFRQVLIGCEAAKTAFIISAEADCLYPPDYFTFIPLREDICYRNSNLYVMGRRRDYFYYKKEGATHSQIVGREYYIKTLKELFKGAPEWNVGEKNFPKERTRKNDVFDRVEYYRTENPVFQIKTGRSMRHYTHSDRTPVYELPYWGKGKEIYNKYLR